MLERIKNSILGGCQIKISADSSADFLNISMEKHIPYGKIEWCSDFFVVDMQRGKAKKLISALEGANISHSEKYYGLPSFIKKYRHRYGIMLGVAFAVFIVWLSQGVIWDVRVSGNLMLTENEIKEELHENGIYPGARIEKTDVDEITNSILINSENIAWMAINLKGNVAYIEVVEKKTFDKKEKTLSNLVAKENGTIERFEVLRGKAVKKVGENVTRGELIVSGIIENKAGEYLTLDAQGKVYAVTHHTFNIKIPLEYEQKIEKNSFCSKKTLNFFGKSINIFEKDASSDTECVKIYKEEYFSPLGLPPLPVGITSELSVEYETERKKRSVKEASDLAFYELNLQISNQLSDADIMKKTIRTEITDTDLILSCDILCSENIAVKQNFFE